MKYAKPEVAVLTSALKAIESGQAIKQPRLVQDVNTASPFLSNGAYEADE